jgi:nucleoside-diphosphate-sugar epimerase
MKIILTGATGVLGSHIMYEILELFTKKTSACTLYIVARNSEKKSASHRITELLTSLYTPSILRKKGINKLNEYIEIINFDLESATESYLEQLRGAYLIHSAGYVNLSTDEELDEKIFNENFQLTKSLFSTLHPYLEKFIYIGTAFSSGARKGGIENDFHHLDFEPKHRNAYERAKYHSEKFIATECKAIGLPFQILRPSVIGGKMLGEENNYFIPKFMVFYLVAKFFRFTAKRKKAQENIRFIVNNETVLNIIPVDYVAKTVVKTFERDDIEQLNIVNSKSFNLKEGLKIIMEEVNYFNYTFVENEHDFQYKNTTEKLYYETIGKHLKPYFIAEANEYNTTELNAILPIPELTNEAFSNMIRYAIAHQFKDINV